MNYSKEECESTISLDINKETYDFINFTLKYKNIDECSKEDCSIVIEKSSEVPQSASCLISIEEVLGKFPNLTFHDDVVIIFSNNVRLSHRRLESKKYTSKQNVCGFYKKRLYPITRTKALEMRENLINMREETVERTNHRLVLEPEKNYGVRVALNKLEYSDGARYTLTGEIEYATDASYEEIILKERELIKKMMIFIKNIPIILDSMSLNDVFSSVVPKVQIWNCYDSTKKSIWAYKWNGVKAKLLYSNDTIFLWPDASEVQSIRVTEKHKAYDILENFCIQVELMESFAVIVHVISFCFQNEIYRIEPLISAKMMYYMEKKFENGNNLVIQNKPYIFQKFYQTELPKTYKREYYDGLIIVQENMIIKWKFPTIDVECVSLNKYKVGSPGKEQILTIKSPDGGILHQIYEISSNYTILRKRNDRKTCSSTEEYEIFLKSLEYLCKK